MATGGAYRIQSPSTNKQFQMPESTEWEEQGISPGLNGIPINAGYKLHTWNFSNMAGCDYDDLAALFDEQQAGNTQLSQLETDPYDGSGAALSYGTQIYLDFIILDISPRTRGMPFYERVSVRFEIFTNLTAGLYG